MQRYTVDFDETVGTLYFLLEGARIDTSSSTEEDSWLILDYDAEDNIVGLIHCCASDITLQDWKKYETREKLPAWLRDAMDLWYTEGPKQEAEMEAVLGSLVPPLSSEKVCTYEV